MAIPNETRDVAIHRNSSGRSYNNTPFWSIGEPPSQVNASTQEELWQRLYGGRCGKGVPKFHVDDCVRICEVKI